MRVGDFSYMFVAVLWRAKDVGLCRRFMKTKNGRVGGLSIRSKAQIYKSSSVIGGGCLCYIQIRKLGEPKGQE